MPQWLDHGEGAHERQLDAREAEAPPGAHQEPQVVS
jgi:hypothetical protein